VISLTTSDPIILVGLYLDPPDRALVLCCDENTKEAVAMNEGFRRQVLDLYRHRAGEGSAAFHVELDIYYINQQGAVRRRFTKTPKWAWLRKKGYEAEHFI
jgi:hypothetical protein